MKKIAIIGPIHKDGWEVFKKLNFDVFEITDLSNSNLIKQLKDIDGIALRTANLGANVMKECTKLKIVSRHGVGYDNVDISYLNKNNLALAVTGTSNAISVAEHVLTMFLYLAKNIHLSDALTKNGNFDKKTNLPNFFELFEKNILIMGFGRIGQAVAKRCLGFESNVYVYDPFVNKKTIEEKNCKKIDFLKGIEIADFITIHMPLNKETKNLIANDELKMMKKNCILINTARGGIINEEDLLSALTNNEILAAGLDVFTDEPPSKSNPLLKLNNILLSPHNAALTLECRRRMAIETAENIAFYLEDQKKLNKNNIVNRKILGL
ncbi:hydroxyacid dehydrogenase [Alphaproteobacteria bacterium]|nr:hydroxyacid dehydrogenase [Alphaproteobacteria bacterium]